jgi:hypothetical protein
MASFTVVGPVLIPVLVGRAGGKSVDRDRLEEFWDGAGCAQRIGCYVFGIRTGPGTLPYYAGRTLNSFRNECFTADKLTKYHYVLMNIARGTPVMYFTMLDVTRGRTNETAVRALEERLIGLGMQRNTRMANVSNTREEDIVVHGVMGPRRGRPTVPAGGFKAMMGID